MKRKKELSVEDKYFLYENSVQNVWNDIKFLNKEFINENERTPLSIREDFCGTSLFSKEWVTQSDQHKSFSIDLDPEPLEYGKQHHLLELDDSQKERIELIEGNVLSNYPFKTDVVVALNFSYNIFKKRNELVEYFKSIYNSLEDGGMFMLDIFGGLEAHDESINTTQYANHTYYWQCHYYNPLTNEVKFTISFKYKGKVYDDVFTYDWRLWTCVEIMEVLEEVGFKKVNRYWEETDDDGTGNGNFYVSTEAENCQMWVSYLCAFK